MLGLTDDDNILDFDDEIVDDSNLNGFSLEEDEKLIIPDNNNSVLGSSALGGIVGADSLNNISYLSDNDDSLGEFGTSFFGGLGEKFIMIKSMLMIKLIWLMKNKMKPNLMK